MSHLIVLVCFLTFACCEGYYWKDWNGSIPTDAFPAGKDSRGNTYIAQAYVPQFGIYVGQIYPDQHEIFINTDVYGNKPVHKTHYNLKILCSNESDLRWMVSNINKTSEILKNGAIDLVKGGVSVAKNTVYIGKYFDSENVFIGNVHGDWLNEMRPEFFLYYSNLVPLSGFSTYYEILITINNYIF